MSTLYRIDFLCKGDIIVECKSVEELTSTHRAQLFNYMRLRKATCGILVNFSNKEVEVQRFFYDADVNEILTINGKTVYGYLKSRNCLSQS